MLHIPLIEAAGYFKLDIIEAMSVLFNPQAGVVWGDMGDIMKDFLKVRNLKLLKWYYNIWKMTTIALINNLTTLSCLQDLKTQQLIDSLNFRSYKSWKIAANLKMVNSSLRNCMRACMLPFIHSANIYCHHCVYCQNTKLIGM